MSGALTTPNELPAVIDAAITDLSGVIFSTADVIQYVSRLASAAQKLDVPGAQKLEYVMMAGHILIDRYIPQAERASAHGLIDVVVPAAIKAILDVAKGRVEIGPAIMSTVEAVMKSPGVEAVGQSVLSCCMTALFRR